MQRSTAVLKSQAFIYDFIIDGGAIGTYISPVTIPAGAVIRSPFLHVLVTYTGGGSSIDVGYGGSSDFLSGMGPQAAGYVSLPAVAPNVLSTGAFITIAIIGAPITAGKIKFVFPYYESF